MSPDAETNILPAFWYLATTSPKASPPDPTTTADINASGAIVFVLGSNEPVTPHLVCAES